MRYFGGPDPCILPFGRYPHDSPVVNRRLCHCIRSAVSPGLRTRGKVVSLQDGRILKSGNIYSGRVPAFRRHNLHFKCRMFLSLDICHLTCIFKEIHNRDILSAIERERTDTVHRDTVRKHPDLSLIREFQHNLACVYIQSVRCKRLGNICACQTAQFFRREHKPAVHGLNRVGRIEPGTVHIDFGVSAHLSAKNRYGINPELAVPLYGIKPNLPDGTCPFAVLTHIENNFRITVLAFQIGCSYHLTAGIGSLLVRDKVNRGLADGFFAAFGFHAHPDFQCRFCIQIQVVRRHQGRIRCFLSSVSHLQFIQRNRLSIVPAAFYFLLGQSLDPSSVVLANRPPFRIAIPIELPVAAFNRFQAAPVRALVHQYHMSVLDIHMVDSGPLICVRNDICLPICGMCPAYAVTITEHAPDSVNVSKACQA